MKSKTTLLTVFLLITLFSYSQDTSILATLNPGYNARVIGKIDNSVIFHDGPNIYISDGSESGTKVIGEMTNDVVVSHSRTELKGKYYFILQGDRFSNDPIENSLIEIDPVDQTMTRILENQKKITGLINYNGSLYFGLSEHPTYGSSYMKFDVETSELQEVFKITNEGVEDAIRHQGLIYLILKSTTQSGTYLAKSNGGVGILDEYYYLGNSEDRNIDPNRINMTSAANKLYFWHSLDYTFYSLYVTEGASSNTLKLKEDFRRNSANDYSVHRYRDIITQNDRIIFDAQDVAGNPTVSRLWASDGTVNGTNELFYEGEGIRFARDFALLGSELYLSGEKAISSSKNRILSISENTDVLNSAISFTGQSNDISEGGWGLTNHNEKLYFSAITIGGWIDLYTKSSTSNTINRVAIIEENIGYILEDFVSAGNNLFFFLMNANSNSQLRIYKPEPSSSVEPDNKLYSIYPNPARSRINVSGHNDSAIINIIDANGRIIEKHLGENQTIDVSNLESGIYYLQIQGDNSYIPIPFIKF